jgi:Mg2+ and Co2+ transporter CorA
MEQVLEKPQPSLRQKLKGPVYAILSDDVMMVLAILLIPAIGLPIVATFSPIMLLFFDIINYSVIAIFAIEYVLKLYVDDSRSKFIFNPWHILDLLIIVFAVADILPFIQAPGGRLSPLLRLSRVFFVMGRTIRRVSPVKKSTAARRAEPQIAIKAFDGSRISAYDHKDIMGAIGDPSNKWIDVQNIPVSRIREVSQALGLPGEQIENKLMRESFPRIDFKNGHTTIFIRDLKMESQDLPSLYTVANRSGILIVCAGDRIMTISKDTNDLFDRVTGGKLAFQGDPVPVRALCGIFELKTRDYEEMTHFFEDRVLWFEEEPVKDMKPEFLDECFYMKKDSNRFHNTLKHYKQVLEVLKGHRPTLNGMGDRHLEAFGDYYYETEYLHEIVETIKDNLMSIIELHLNTVSFDVNRVIRLLSIITVLGIIPTIAFGLLGSNLDVAPFQATALEVIVIVLTLMFLALYIFYKAGWVK